MTQPNNCTRDLVKADLGLDSEPVEVVGKVFLTNEEMAIQIELIQGLILNSVFGVISSLCEWARNSGAKRLVIAELSGS